MAFFPTHKPIAETPAGTMQKAAIWMPTKHMGNLLVSLRAIEALIQHFGAANTTLVVDNAYRHIIDCFDPRCDVLYFPRAALARPPWRTLPHLWPFLRSARAIGADIAIALEGDRPSQRLIPLSRPRHTLGPDNRYCRKFDRRIALDHGQLHRFHDYAAVVKAITGRDLDPGYPALSSRDETRLQLEHRLATLGIQPASPVTVLHPGATKHYKQWPLEHFADLARQLHGQGHQLVITGAGDRDGVAVAGLQQLAKVPLTSLHNQLGIAELVALCQRAALFVGNDTGPTHLAAATGTRTVAVFGPTDEHRWGPMGDRVRIVRHQLPCPADCRRGRCSLDHRCLNTLTAEPVQAAIAELP